MLAPRPLPASLHGLIIAFALASACSRSPITTSQDNLGGGRADDEGRDNSRQVLQTYEQEATRMRAAQLGDTFVSSETRTLVRAMAEKSLTVSGQAHIAILYYKDRPAHRLATLRWLADHSAKVEFESRTFGYIDAVIGWSELGKLLDTSGQLGLDETSLLKLELDAVSVSGVPHLPRVRTSHIADRGPSLSDVNSSFLGPVHSAGYGAKVSEFRDQVSRELGLASGSLDGRGYSIAVYDQGIDLSRTDVFGDRIKDFFIGNFADWIPAEKTLAQFTGATDPLAVVTPEGLEDVASEPSLRVVELGERAFQYDLNGSGATDDAIAIAVFEVNGEVYVRVRPAEGMGFGDTVADFGAARRNGAPAIVDLYTGRHYIRAAVNPSPSAAGFKTKRDAQGKLWVAIVGTANGSDHGIANLHMAGGNYIDPSGSVRYLGVAPAVSFYGMQTWKVDNSEYGSKWIPLARSMIQAAEASADVIDLDIYTPGSRVGNDLLSSLACRISGTTNTALVAAAHNFGPLPDTIQSLAQSPCVLGIGASHSRAALRYGRNQGSIDPRMAADDSVQIAHYSGRGFALNGLFKPDIIAPAYGYTAYGRNFTRFGGTSGATPTTAGMIALLKQATGILGGTLNHDQTRFVLQGGSDAITGADSLRDGFGYANMIGAWNFLKQTRNQAGRVADPFLLSGHVYTAFDSLPNRHIIPLRLVRIPTLNSVDGPRPMHFSIDYAAPNGGNWLKFYDAPSGAISDRLDLDSPMHGEAQTLRIKIDIDAASFAALPDGEHIALVKGIRKDLPSTPRGVDFLMPVTITKTKDIDESVFSLPPLYADQHVSYSLQAKAGDRFLFTAIPSCLGRDIGTGAVGSNSDGLVFTVDHEAAYPHASAVMNSYAPLVLSGAGVQVDAKKSSLTFDIRRSGQFNCDGPISGRILVRRTSVGVQVAHIAQTTTADGFKVVEKVNLSLAAGTLANAEINRGSQWSIASDSGSLVARREVTGSYSMVVPDGVAKVRAIPMNDNKFRAVLATVNDQGVTAVASTSDGDAAGLSSVSLNVGGVYFGPQIDHPKAGDTLHFSAASTNSKAVLVLEFKGPSSLGSVGMPTVSVDQWLRNQVRPITLTAVFSDQAVQLASQLGQDWTFGVATALRLTEQQANGTGTAGPRETILWSGDVEVPISFGALE